MSEMRKIKIGILRETKTPVDNRVPLTPNQCRLLMDRFEDLEIVVQPSTIRAFKDNEYKSAGITMSEDVSHCDYLLGVKEVAIDNIIPGRHYIFFGHIAKMQSYNRPLCKSMVNKNITFTDWEYLTDDEGNRVIAFGRWAGIVGSYNALRLYGLRNNIFNLPAPDLTSTYVGFLTVTSAMLKLIKDKNINIMITGDGRVAHGAIEFFNAVGVEVEKAPYHMQENEGGLRVFQLTLSNLVENKIEGGFSETEFKYDPSKYKSRFREYSDFCDILISCHYWQNNAPVYVTNAMLKDTRIDTIADVTCDINGSIGTTIRSSTHDAPFYGIDRLKNVETDYMDTNSIGVMAVDTCPNALPRDASESFGDMIIQYLIPEIIHRKHSEMIDRATIIKNGKITDKYQYLKAYAGE